MHFMIKTEKKESRGEADSLKGLGHEHPAVEEAAQGLPVSFTNSGQDPGRLPHPRCPQTQSGLSP